MKQEARSSYRPCGNSDWQALVVVDELCVLLVAVTLQHRLVVLTDSKEHVHCCYRQGYAPAGCCPADVLPTLAV
jgi:hypothetical protein